MFASRSSRHILKHTLNGKVNEDVLGDEVEEEPKPTGLAVKEEDSPEITVDVAAEKVVVKTTVKCHR